MQLFFPENRELRKFPGRELWLENHREIPAFGNPDVRIDLTLQSLTLVLEACKPYEQHKLQNIIEHLKSEKNSFALNYVSEY